MATKKKAAKKVTRTKVWFSSVLPIDKKNDGLTVSQKKKKAEDDCKKILKKTPRGLNWEISSFKWSGRERHRLIVKLRRKKPNGPIPPDSTVPKAPTMPPPSM